MLLALLACADPALFGDAHAADPPVVEGPAPVSAALRPGDLLFHRSRSAQSEAIARATKSPLTHVGVVLEHQGRLQVFEAVQPVGWAEPGAWVARGDGALTHLRLADADAVLTAPVLAEMGRLADTWAGLPYDAAFGWSDDRLYCSELVYKLYERAAGVELGGLRALRTFDLADPIVSAALRQRYGGAVPLDEPVVAPSDLAADPRLVPARP